MIDTLKILKELVLEKPEMFEKWYPTNEKLIPAWKEGQRNLKIAQICGSSSGDIKK